MFRHEKANDIVPKSSPTPTSTTTASFETIEKMQVEEKTYQELENLMREATEKHVLILFYSHLVLPRSKNTTNL
jgi:hypothetical protein